MACTGLEAVIKFIATLCQSHPNSIATVLITKSDPQGGLISLLSFREFHKGLFGVKEVHVLAIFYTLMCCLYHQSTCQSWESLVSSWCLMVLWKTKTP